MLSSRQLNEAQKRREALLQLQTKREKKLQQGLNHLGTRKWCICMGTTLRWVDRILAMLQLRRMPAW